MAMAVLHKSENTQLTIFIHGALPSPEIDGITIRRRVVDYLNKATNEQPFLIHGLAVALGVNLKAKRSI